MTTAQGTAHKMKAKIGECMLKVEERTNAIADKYEKPFEKGTRTCA